MLQELYVWLYFGPAPPAPGLNLELCLLSEATTLITDEQRGICRGLKSDFIRGV